jgi:hypothetical protein
MFSVASLYVGDRSKSPDLLQSKALLLTRRSERRYAERETCVQIGKIYCLIFP